MIGGENRSRFRIIQLEGTYKEHQLEFSCLSSSALPCERLSHRQDMPLQALVLLIPTSQPRKDPPRCKCHCVVLPEQASRDFLLLQVSWLGREVHSPVPACVFLPADPTTEHAIILTIQKKKKETLMIPVTIQCTI